MGYLKGNDTVALISTVRENRLTWHSGLIPPQEIWVKIGGDKGGGSMKTCFQICNVPHPNSCKNSCVFSIFEAPDTTTNLNIALKPFTVQINNLCGKSIWRCSTQNVTLNSTCTLYTSFFYRNKEVRVFLCGDYAFICIIYGLSGASGKQIAC